MKKLLPLLIIPIIYIFMDVYVRFSLFHLYNSWQLFFYLLSVILSAGFFCCCILLFSKLKKRKILFFLLTTLFSIFVIFSFVGSLIFYYFNGFFPNYYTLLYFKTEPQSAFMLLRDSINLIDTLLFLGIGIPVYWFIRKLSKRDYIIVSGGRLFLTFLQLSCLYFFLWVYHKKFDQCLIVDTNFAISLQRHYFEKKDYKTYSGKGHRVRNSFVLGKTKNKPDFSILLVIFESMRKDRMQCYGYRRESTPNLQEFIQRHQKEFFVFEKPYTVSTTTMLAVPAILTGIGPHENTDKLYSQPIVWDYARKQNYHRFFMSSHTMQWYRFYKFYQNEQLNHFWTKDQSSYPFFNDLGIDDHHTIDHLTKHLAQLNNKPFFGVVQLNGTHYPYKVKKEFEKWNDNFSDGYDNAVLYQDDAMKELFDYLKQSKKEKNTLIIFVSDHAESLKEHNNIGHVDSYYQEAISIPLMLYIPKALQKKYPIATLKENIRTNVANTDIAPTVIDLLQLKQDKEIKSLYSNFSGFSLLRKVPKNRPIIIMNNNEIARFRVGVSLVKGKYHYLWRTNIVPNKEEIYNLEQDPKELSNLFPQWSTKQIYNLKKVLKQEKNCLPYLKHHDAF